MHLLFYAPLPKAGVGHIAFRHDVKSVLQFTFKFTCKFTCIFTFTFTSKLLITLIPFMLQS